MKGKRGNGNKAGASISKGIKPVSALVQLAKKQRAILLRGGGRAPAAGASPPPATRVADSSNPFDKFSNPRKKHEVVNRRVKGEDRNVGRARDKSVEDRKKRLLVDYQQSKKSNSFQDKRFGEQDPTLSLEEKMFVRFQKERLKKARNSSVFNLDSSDGRGGGADEVLTHKGKVLGDGNYDERGDFEDDDDDDNLGRDVVNQLHFGGGLVPKVVASSSSGTEPGEGADSHQARSSSRLDALQEIVMKSKLHKLEKKEAKEAQETEREDLDKAFEALVAESAVTFRPTRRDRSEDDGGAGGSGAHDTFAEYDKVLRAMAFEAKAKASDRTKTPEELAVAEKLRLEEAEAARKRRMRGVIEAEGGTEAERALTATGNGSGLGGKRKGKGKSGGDKGGAGSAGAKRRKTDDDLDGDQPGDIVTNNYGWDEEEEEEEEEGGEEDEEEDEDEDEDDDEEEDEDEDEDDDEEEDEDEDEDDEEEERAGRRRGRGRNPASASSSTTTTTTTANNNNSNNSNNNSDSNINPEMPHTLACPESIEDLDALLARYARSSGDFCAIFQRIVVYHSVHLPAPDGPRNKVLMAGFLELALRVFVRVGDSLSGYDKLLAHPSALGVSTAARGAPCPDHPQQLEITTHDTTRILDHLTGLLYRLCKDLPDAAPTVWAKTLRGMQQLLQSRLRDASDGLTRGGATGCWPSLGRLLLLRLAGQLFSATDFRHAIVTPASLLLCQCLTQCPVTCATDAASGIMASAVLLSFTEETKRLVPEATIFLHSLIRLYAMPPQSSSSSSSSIGEIPVSILGTFDRTKLAALREAAAHDSNPSPPSSSSSSSSWSSSTSTTPALQSNCIPWKYFSARQGGAGRGFTPEVARSLFCSALRLADIVVQRHASQQLSALPELLLPLLEALDSVASAQAPGSSSSSSPSPVLLPPCCSEPLESLLAAVKRASAAQLKARRPLQWRKSELSSIETKAPKFQLDYTFKKDTDPDADRAKMKQLKRQLKREEKAAMRELRRDGEFLDRERFREKSEAAEARKSEHAKNFAFMEEQQAHINEQVRKGGGLLKGGGSGVVPKALRSKDNKRRR